MVYVHLFHGRKDPKQDMNDWGEDGGILGGFDFAHVTYGNDIKCGNDFESACFYIIDGLVYYDGMWYGDFSVFDENVCRECAKESGWKLKEFEHLKAELPKGDNPYLGGGKGE